MNLSILLLVVHTGLSQNNCTLFFTVKLSNFYCKGVFEGHSLEGQFDMTIEIYEKNGLLSDSISKEDEKPQRKLVGVYEARQDERLIKPKIYNWLSKSECSCPQLLYLHLAFTKKDSEKKETKTLVMAIKESPFFWLTGRMKNLKWKNFAFPVKKCGVFSLNSGEK